MARTGTPIVFIHKGYPAYLRFTLRQARWASPECPVYLLGDAANQAAEADGHFRIEDYREGTKAFDQVYVHLSAGSDAFERFCFHRWFVLRDLVRRQGWERVWCLDSDVLLYDSLEQETAALDGFDMAVCHAGVPAYTYFTAAALERFCQYILQLYTDPDRLGELRNQFEYYLKTNPGITWGGITDMHAFWMYAQEPDANAEDLAEPRGGAVFDQDFHQPQGFVMDAALGEKKIVWTNRTPFFVSASTGVVCRAKGLHCASGGKHRIFAYYTAPGLQWEQVQHQARQWVFGLRKRLSPRALLGKVLGR